jgi:uncharacterized C2H2 Zn-finger protein
MGNDVFECPNCGLVFKNPLLHLNHVEDFKRYSSHQNDEKDQRYLDFLNKLVTPLLPFLPNQFCALDFGCGPGPALSLILEGHGGVVRNYDPLFFPNTDILNLEFDVVTSSEVVEHFKNPKYDWEQLIARVKSKGLLGIMTQFINPEINYISWWYKNDPTHVVFYQEKTLHYLAKTYHLEILFNDKKSVVIFRKK